MQGKHNKHISTAKGIGIGLMVVGHSGCPELLHDFIYLFHMPLFFFITGYLYKSDYTNNKMTYIKRRIKSLYIPFVQYGLLFLMFRPLFEFLNFYDSHYSAHEYFKMLYATVTMGNIESLLGGFWFLRDLFIGSITLLIIAFIMLIASGKLHKLLYTSILPPPLAIG